VLSAALTDECLVQAFSLGKELCDCLRRAAQHVLILWQEQAQMQAENANQQKSAVPI
jgi:hypothetical protein